MQKLFERLLLIVACMAANTVSAADNWYRVELIVFELPQADSQGWIVENSLPDTRGAISLLSPDTDSIQAIPWQGLIGHHLQHVYRRLRSSVHYRPLLYLSWLQPEIHTQAQARRIDLSGYQPASTGSTQGGTGMRVMGYVRIRSGVYLDADMDIALLKTRLLATPSSPTIAQDATANPQVYARLRQSRRIKLNELHYFDHPGMGVLLELRRWKPDT